MATAITIHGGSGADTINYSFVVTGTNTTRYASQYATAVNSLLAAGDPLTLVHSSGGDALMPNEGAQTHIYDLIPSTVNGATNVFNIFSAGYVIDSVSGGSQLNLAGGDTVLVAGQNSETTVTSANAGVNGNNDQIVFVSGNNEYIGDTTAGAGNGDSIVAGSGFDTISTGGGSATVNSGTGDATIYLNDTIAGTSINQFVWLDDGHSVVFANGTNDAVIATGAGQTVDGGANAASDLWVILQSGSSGDLVNGGAGVTSVFDSGSGNTINGGTGALSFVAGTDIAATVNGGGGPLLMFGAAGDSITLGNSAGVTTGVTEFIAGAGSESLGGASAASNLALFGSTSDTGANDTLTGGFGSDTLVAGVGNETLTGGAGTNLFLLDTNSDAGGNITIADFGASATNEIAFGGYSPSDVASALANGTEANGNFTITLSDNTTVTFTGVTGASELTGHIITF